MIRIGIAGLGFMGMVHYLTYQKLRGVQVVALCEQNRKRLAGDWRDIQGNFGPRGQQMDRTGVRTYTELADMLPIGEVRAVANGGIHHQGEDEDDGVDLAAERLGHDV